MRVASLRVASYEFASCKSASCESENEHFSKQTFCQFFLQRHSPSKSKIHFCLI